MNLGNLLQDWGRKIPGHNWLSGSFLGDVVTGGLARGAERNHWSMPFGHDTSSFDDIFGAGASRTHGGRNLARGIGAAFGGGALYGAFGSGSAAGAEGVGEAGGGGAGGELGTGALEGGGIGEASGSTSPGWQDYLRRYGQQGTNLLSQMMGGQGGASPAGAMDNGMIAPIPVHDEFMRSGNEISPGLIALLLSQQMREPAETQDSSPYLGSRGLA